MGGRGIKYIFPTRYNIGPIANASTDGTILPVTETRSVKIRVHSPNVDDQSVLIDYLFELEGQDSETYFMYDPTVAAVEEVVDEVHEDDEDEEDDPVTQLSSSPARVVTFAAGFASVIANYLISS